MPTPYLPLVAFTGSYSVQNRTDLNNQMQTYVAFRNVPNSQFQLANTDTPIVVFQIDRGILVALTASISSSIVNAAVTGSF
jgi:hypothetical protein